MSEEDRTVPGEDGQDAVLPPGLVEGALGRGTVPYIAPKSEESMHSGMVLAPRC